MRKIVLATAVLLSGVWGCVSERNAKPEFVATILPVKYIVETITGGDMRVNVLVPPGAGPETYEPTPLQMVECERAELLFSTGLIDFEKTMTERIGGRAEGGVVNLSQGIELAEGACGHVHDTHHSHVHGADPHIWLSVRNLKVMAANAWRAIEARYPDSTRYRENFTELVSVLDSVDRQISARITEGKYLITYHPVLTYYARDYGLHQLAIEQDGKEPSAEHLRAVIDTGKMMGIGTVFFQSQFPAASVETVAADCGAEAVEIDPLAENVVDNILSITDLITR